MCVTVTVTDNKNINANFSAHKLIKNFGHWLFTCGQ